MGYLELKERNRKDRKARKENAYPLAPFALYFAILAVTFPFLISPCNSVPSVSPW
jgi:hypothetical protein